MKLTAVLLAVAAWCFAAPANSHAVPTTINFDDATLSWQDLGRQFASQGVTFESRECESGAWIVPRDTAYSRPQNAELICGGGELRSPASGIDARFAQSQRQVSVRVRGEATLTVYGQGDPPVLAVASHEGDGEWHRLTASLPGQQISALRISSSSPRGLQIDDLEFERDETAPTIYIYGPREGAVYAQGESVRAAYNCYDSESGIATPDGCKRPSVDGYALDTSTLGEHEFVVEARDNAGNTATKTVKYKVVDTKISLSPACDASGTEGNYTITVSGFGLDPARRGVLEFSRGEEDAWQADQDVVPEADGTFSVEIKPPRQTDGFYDVTLRYSIPPYGRVGPVIASAVFAVPCPTLEVQPACGPAATGFPDFYMLSLVGKGFPPRSNATLAFAGEQIGETVVDDGGGFATTITPMLYPPGIHELTAKASTRAGPPPISVYVPPLPPPGANFDVIARTTFKVPCDGPPSITVEPQCGNAGATTIRVSGEHFVAGRDVDLLLDGGDVGRARTAAAGTLDAQISVNGVGDGDHIVSARYHDEAASHPRDLPTATYRVPCESRPEPERPPTISVAPTCGPEGLTTVRLTGVDFLADRAVALLFDGRPAGSGRTAASGTLDAMLSVADVQPRLHSVSVRYQGGDEDLAQADYVAPCAPHISVTPDCGQAQVPTGSVGPYTVRVSGRGFVPPGKASVSFDGAIVRSDVEVADDGTLSAPIELDARASGRYEVRVEQKVKVGEGLVNPHVAVTDFTVPCGELTVTPGCDVPLASRGGGELYRLSVQGRSFAPYSSVALTFERVGGVAVAERIARVHKGGNLTTIFKVPRQRGAKFRVRATILRKGVPTTNFVASAFEVPCRTPTIAVDPPLGPPGFLTTVKGRDFPPNARVRLSWDNRSLGSAQVRTDARGRLRTQMFVFLHDLVGPRVVNARTETGYSKASADYLVVPGSQQPGGFLVRR